MKKLFVNAALLLTIVGLALAQESSRPPEDVDLSGFSGFAWGASRGFVHDEMSNDGAVVLSEGPQDLWYRAEIWGEQVNVIYYFDKNGLLNGGAWLIADLDQKSYWAINDKLRKTYNTKAKLTVRGEEYIKSDMYPAGTDAWIEHTLDLTKKDERSAHAVRYRYQPQDSGEE